MKTIKKKIFDFLRKRMMTAIVSTTSTLLTTGIIYIFSFHNDLIAMRTELSEKREVLRSINERLISLEAKLNQIYTILLTKEKR